MGEGKPQTYIMEGNIHLQQHTRRNLDHTISITASKPPTANHNPNVEELVERYSTRCTNNDIANHLIKKNFLHSNTLKMRNEKRKEKKKSPPALPANYLILMVFVCATFEQQPGDFQMSVDGRLY